MEKYLTRKTAIFAVSAIALWKMYLAATLELHPDEAYYWMWSRHLALGYFDHSPLVAYFIKLTTLFSQGELFVRLSSILSTLLVSLIAWLLAMELFGLVTVASASVIVLNILPITMAGSIIITPDIPAFLFWSAASYSFWKLIKTQKPSWWYVTGVLFGLSLLSKYTGFFLAVSFLIFLLVTDERKWLKTVHPYASFVLGLAFFLPVILWNASNDWISLKFQFGHGLGGTGYSISRVLEYVGGQLMVANPLVWPIGIYACFVFLFSREKEKIYLSIMSLFLILFFAYTSLKKLAGPNWPATAYFTFSIVFARYLLDGNKIKKGVLVLSVFFCFLLSFIATLHARFTIVPLDKISEPLARADATNFLYGWRTLGQKLLEDPETKFALTSSHQTSAVISYYTKEKVYAYVDTKLTRTSQFNIWGFPEGLKNKKGVYIYLEGDGVGPIKDYIEPTGEKDALMVYRYDIPLREYRFVYGHGYKK
ncbi:MAG: glycosyltransferase family 39 protein [Endomicrobiales bacterium]|nr:glycosyltransferase family 39 protein [Endomicrobiales bacterium]